MKAKYVLLIPIIALLAAGCSKTVTTTPTGDNGTDTYQVSPSPQSEITPAPTATSSIQSQATTTTPSVVKTFTVTGTNFAFSPNKLTVNLGDTVKIIFKNSGSYSHNLGIDQFNLATKTISPGETDTIQFVADKAGTFEYSCSVDHHKEMGMVGSLVVK